MTKLQELTSQIKELLAENSDNLVNGIPNINDLSKRCENIHNSLNSIDSSLNNFRNLAGDEEIALQERQKTLQQLKLTELTSENLKAKLEQILKSASENIKETETELENILTQLNQQQAIIANKQAELTSLETKINSYKSEPL
jgi:chromosome segregation ATPase